MKVKWIESESGSIVVAVLKQMSNHLIDKRLTVLTRGLGSENHSRVEKKKQPPPLWNHVNISISVIGENTVGIFDSFLNHHCMIYSRDPNKSVIHLVRIFDFATRNVFLNDV